MVQADNFLRMEPTKHLYTEENAPMARLFGELWSLQLPLPERSEPNLPWIFFTLSCTSKAISKSCHTPNLSVQSFSLLSSALFQTFGNENNKKSICHRNNLTLQNEFAKLHIKVQTTLKFFSLHLIYFNFPSRRKLRFPQKRVCVYCRQTI